MNVRSMKTVELMAAWRKLGPSEDQPVIDELYRRCNAAGHFMFKIPGCSFTFTFFRNHLGKMRIIADYTALAAHELDEHIETSPQPTDGLAFQPSDELDAATLAQ